jgi:hypothetical protein
VQATVAVQYAPGTGDIAFNELSTAPDDFDMAKSKKYVAQAMEDARVDCLYLS